MLKQQLVKLSQSRFGTARVVPVAGLPGAGRLEVRFAPSWLGWLPMVWSDYWILYVDPAYRHAVVGTPDRKRLWLLSRTPDIAPTDYERLLTQVRDSGFDAARVMRTPQHR